MPQIETISVPTYQPLDPYHHLVDNLPINGLIDRIALVNTAVDLNTTTLVESIGTQGTLSNRLAQSINDDGSLKTVAIDNALHSIAQHLDSGGYVRMTSAERAKLSFIAPEATNLIINVSTISGTIAFSNSILNIAGSDSIVWDYNGTQLLAETNFPSSVRHNHFYGLVPITSNYLNYKTTTINTAYKSGTLRVYINGVRLNSANSVYVPFGTSSPTTWVSLSYAEGTSSSGIVTGGDFALSSAIPVSYRSNTRIVIDFDVLYS